MAIMYLLLCEVAVEKDLGLQRMLMARRKQARLGVFLCGTRS